MKKRLVATLLVLCIVLGMLPATAHGIGNSSITTKVVHDPRRNGYIILVMDEQERVKQSVYYDYRWKYSSSNPQNREMVENWSVTDYEYGINGHVLSSVEVSHDWETDGVNTTQYTYEYNTQRIYQYEENSLIAEYDMNWRILRSDWNLKRMVDAFSITQESYYLYLYEYGTRNENEYFLCNKYYTDKNEGSIYGTAYETWYDTEGGHVVAIQASDGVGIYRDIPYTYGSNGEILTAYSGDISETAYHFKYGESNIITGIDITGKEDSGTVQFTYNEEGLTRITANGRIIYDAVSEIIPGETSSITTLYPANSSIFDHTSTSGDKAFHITFDREVSNAGGNRPELDFSVGTLEVHKASDDSVVYRVTESPFTPGVSSDVSLYGATAPFTAVSITGITLELDYDTEYYVTMPAGFIKMANETGSPEIKKGAWTFKTVKGTSAQEYNFSYALDGGSWSLPEECYTYSAGEQIVIESEAPLKDGYYFVGWSDGSRTYQPGGTYTMPSHDVTLTAQWGIGPLNLINIARDEIIVTESYTAAPRYTLVDGATVSWTSADSSIASVDSNGIVTGVHFGKTTITGKVIAPGAMQTVSYPVTVNPNYKISFTNAVVHLAPGKSTELYCNVLPLDGKGHIKFHSDKPEIVSVSGNTITAVGEGSATITASFDPAWLNEFPCEIPPVATCKVTVSNGEKLAQLFVNEALKYVGYSEDKFERTTNSTVSNGNWCSDFIGVCAELVGAEEVLPRESAGYKLSQRIVAKGGSVVDTPQKGDIITFRSSSGYGHVGIVCDVDTNTVYVVHGNWHSHVCAPDGYGSNNQNCIKYSSGKSKSCGKWNIKTKQGPGATIDLYTRPNWDIAAGIKYGTLECRINCPVDVRFAYDGEVLDSATEQFEASFGTMERTGEDGLLVHLNNYYNDMDITINGTGVGTMDITSTFRDSDGATSTRKFQGVPITEETIGKLFVYDSAATEILEIYRDNGNTFVEVWAADGNSTVSSADKDLTDWYLNGDTSDVESDIPIAPTPTYPTSSNTGENSSSTTHSITVPSFKGGTVTVNPKSASKGATVVLTAIPDEGYELSSIAVTDNKGNELELTDKGNSKYTFIMPASAVTVNAVFEKIEPAESTPVDETYLFPFTDVLKTDWFCGAVEYVFNNELMSGTAPYTFDPQGKMNRAMVWTVLGRMADADVDGSESPWYSKAQTWAMSSNMSDGTNPTNSISRQELMTMLWRYMGSPAATADLSKFSDRESVADWADAAMQWAVSTGLIVGDNGRLNPTGDARRCEVATIFMRFCESIAE